ncbi:Holliday junction branch migration protein RuvA [Granulosicoccus sp. 3-233]|uniref:Holliday junction branch migration protein RuvA n=1 Tax=Granulosicoccus sp. 3-233 TaxID=3417969 RepID=UPI003D348E04
MIGRLTGVLLEKNPPSLLVDVQGVGYEVDVPMSTFYALPAQGEAVALFTHLVVREDAQLLYGFGSRTERLLFRALLKVNGVGAKVALAILSGLSTDEFLSCIASKDVSALVCVPGIGKKTAERLLVELQDKVDALGVGSAVPSGTLPLDNDPSAREQAEEALVALGYKPAEANRLLDKNSETGQSVEQMIRAALRGAAR